jgi:hypothetical protein
VVLPVAEGPFLELIQANWISDGLAVRLSVFCSGGIALDSLNRAARACLRRDLYVPAFSRALILIEIVRSHALGV